MDTNTYRLQVLFDLPRGFTRDDAHAIIVSNLPEVERSSVTGIGRNGLIRVMARFEADTDTVARDIAQGAAAGLGAAHDFILDRLDGRKFTRVER